MERAAKNSQHLPSAEGAHLAVMMVLGLLPKTDKEMRVIGLRAHGLPVFQTCINFYFY